MKQPNVNMYPLVLLLRDSINFSMFFASLFEAFRCLKLLNE
jgi:hypothetical protein